MTYLEVLQTGAQCLVEDLGRPGLAGQGVTLSGAVDRGSLMRGNRLLGNEIHAAGAELLLGGLQMRASDPVLVAVTGAWCPTSVDGMPVPFGTPVLLRGGSVLRIGRTQSGLRSYLTVRGGLEPAGAFAGSWSTDTSSGIGPAPVRPGDRLPVGQAPAQAPRVAEVPPAIQPREELVLGIMLGPRPTAPGLRSGLTRAAGSISADSDRIGIRLNGFQLPEQAAFGRSEALPLGAVQAPPSGELIVFVADHPTTGGYPVVGVVPPADLDRLAQCVPGTRVRFAIRSGPAS